MPVDDGGTGAGGDQPTVTIQAGDPITEGGVAAFGISVSGSSEHTAEVQYVASSTDESPEVSGTLWIPPSWYSGAARGGSTQVPTIDDVWDGSTTPALLTMNLTGAAGVTLGNSSASVTVNQIQTTASIGSPATSVKEGGWAKFPVTLTKPVNYAVKVTYTLSDGTAQAGIDYDATGGTLWIPAGTTTATICVRTMQHLQICGDTDFSVSLGSAVGATLGTSTAAATITHDRPVVSIGDVTVTAGDTAEFVVTLLPSVNYPVSMQFETQDGTADAGKDYLGTVAKRTLWFFPGETSHKIDVPTMVDFGTQAKNFEIIFSNFVGAVGSDAPVNSGNSCGDTTSTANGYIIDPALIAHRTGGYYGRAVAESDRNSLNPLNYVNLVNDDYEQDPTGTLDDLGYNTGLIAQGQAVNVGDCDLARITLKQVGSTSGTVQLVLSNSASVRLYDDTGHLLTALSAALNGSDYLSGLASHDVDIYIEGLQVDRDFSLTYDYPDAVRNVQGSVSVHMVIADLSVVGASGNSLSSLPLDDDLADMLDGGDDTETDGLIQADEFRTRIDGLYSGRIKRVTVMQPKGSDRHLTL